MGQSDVYEILKMKRLLEGSRYYSVEDIRKALKDKGLPNQRAAVNNSLLKLRVFGYLDVEIKANQKNNIKKLYTAYRLKREVLNS